MNVSDSPSSMLCNLRAKSHGSKPRISRIARNIEYCMVEYAMLRKFQMRQVIRISTNRAARASFKHTTASSSPGQSGARSNMFCRVNP
ncbi:MAG: hypothetical protein BWY92_01950 [Firmicutes bacterium ADurb.BinA052]|nr:MAG: hypothetical protein BWY92_01950 [Firmicutes bacterium ADurb.BinA052]